MFQLSELLEQRLANSELLCFLEIFVLLECEQSFSVWFSNITVAAQQGLLAPIVNLFAEYFSLLQFINPCVCVHMCVHICISLLMYKAQGENMMIILYQKNPRYCSRKAFRLKTLHQISRSYVSLFVTLTYMSHYCYWALNYSQSEKRFSFPTIPGLSVLQDENSLLFVLVRKYL